MNPIIDLIKAHRSIRKFTDQEIDKKILEQIFLAGRSASTSSYIQAVSIIHVTDRVKRLKLTELGGKQSYIATAAEFLVLCADLHRNKQIIKFETSEAEFSWTEQFLAASIDVALVAQNIAIASESLGLGCCFIGGIRNNPNQVSDLLELPNLVYPVFGLCIGYPDQQPELKPRLPLAVTVHQNSYSWDQIVETELNAFDELVREYYLSRTHGKLDQTWREQLVRQASTQSRPFMKNFLNSKGFMQK